MYKWLASLFQPEPKRMKKFHVFTRYLSGTSLIDVYIIDKKGDAKLVCTSNTQMVPWFKKWIEAQTLTEKDIN